MNRGMHVGTLGARKGVRNAVLIRVFQLVQRGQNRYFSVAPHSRGAAKVLSASPKPTLELPERRYRLSVRFVPKSATSHRSLDVANDAYAFAIPNAGCTRRGSLKTSS